LKQEKEKEIAQNETNEEKQLKLLFNFFLLFYFNLETKWFSFKCVKSFKSCFHRGWLTFWVLNFGKKIIEFKENKEKEQPK